MKRWMIVLGLLLLVYVVAFAASWWVEDEAVHRAA